jgi:hypothetical protein
MRTVWLLYCSPIVLGGCIRRCSGVLSITTCYVAMRGVNTSGRVLLVDSASEDMCAELEVCELRGEVMIGIDAPLVPLAGPYVSLLALV